MRKQSTREALYYEEKIQEKHCITRKTSARKVLYQEKNWKILYYEKNEYEKNIFYVKNKYKKNILLRKICTRKYCIMRKNK